ncbi:MAG: MBL fold metallo-hydrolase [Anaerolineae bacterium]
MHGEQILPHLYRIAWWEMSGSDSIDADCFAIDCGPQVVVVDAGQGGRSYDLMKANLAHWELLERVTDLLLTHYHFDHSGGAAQFQADGVKLWGSEGLQAFLAAKQAENFSARVFKLDRVTQDNETFTIGDVTFTALATPGHTTSCMTFLATIDSLRCAFTGDMFMVNGTIGYSGSVDFDQVVLMRSLERLAGADFEAVFTGHMLAASQPEGFWLHDGKVHLQETIQAGREGKWVVPPGK